MKSKKINLIIGTLVIILLGGFGSFKYINNKKSNEKVTSMIEENTSKENKNKDESKLEDKETEVKENENNSDGIEVPEGFKTSIASGNTEEEIIKNNIGPAVGSHSGPGTLALFFIGNSR